MQSGRSASPSSNGLASTNRFSVFSQSDPSEKESKIDLNKATLEELQTLPGIDYNRAKAILAYRVAQGGFKEVEEVNNVFGISDGLFIAIRPRITLSVSSPEEENP